jgi:hypothetical protein
MFNHRTYRFPLKKSLVNTTHEVKNTSILTNGLSKLLVTMPLVIVCFVQYIYLNKLKQGKQT